MNSASRGTLIGGGALITVALFMLLGFFNVSQPPSAPAAIATLLFTVGLPGAAGVALIRSYFKRGADAVRRREDLRHQTYESEVLRLGEDMGGKLTVVEVVARLGLTPEVAEHALGRLMERGLADIEITDAGLIVYAFHDIPKLKDKGSSRDVLHS